MWRASSPLLSCFCEEKQQAETALTVKNLDEVYCESKSQRDNTLIYSFSFYFFVKKNSQSSFCFAAAHISGRKSYPRRCTYKTLKMGNSQSHRPCPDNPNSFANFPSWISTGWYLIYFPLSPNRLVFVSICY